MKILLTGVTGFVGNYFASKWQNGPHQVIGIARSKLKSDLQIPVVYADLTQGIPLEESVDVIVHTVAQSPAPGVNTDTFVRSNVETVRQLIEYARCFNVHRFIYLSSISIYGKISSNLVDENTPIVNPDPYGLTKYLGELLLLDEAQWLSSIALRLPGVLGKGAHAPWLAQLARKIKSGIEVYIYNPDSLFNNMVHIKDLESWISHLINTATQFNGFNAINLGCREPLTVRQTVDSLKKYLNSTSPIQEKHTNQMSFVICIDKACKMGYQPMSAQQILSTFSKEC